MQALLGRYADARGICVAAKKQHEIGGFQVGPRSFVDLALEWLAAK